MVDNDSRRADLQHSGNAFTMDESPSTDNMQAEIRTLESILQEPHPGSSYSHDEECQRIVRLVEQIGVTSPAKVKDAAPVDTLPHERIGQYELLAKLGEGGMGAVYKALHTKLNKCVALKILPAGRLAEAQAVARFEREMKAVGRLSHPNIVAAHDAGEADGHHYLVTELVDGVDLSTLVHRCGPLPIAEACEMIRRAAEGLQHGHGRGMVHRDIKPGNLMLTFEGQVKILDMGLALLDEMRGPGKAELTSTGQLMGTLDYMAPEQGSNSHAVDIRADVYSLGATLFKLLTGEAPFHGPQYDSPVSKLMALATETPRQLRDVRGDVPTELSAIVARMMAKQPGQRPATPQEVIELLAPFAAGARLVDVARIAKEKMDVDEEMDAPSIDTFAHLRSSFTDTTNALLTPRLAHAGSGLRRTRWPWIAAAAGAAAILALITVIVVRNREGKEVARIDVPEGASVEVKANGSSAPPQANLKLPADPVVKPKLPVDPVVKLTFEPESIYEAGGKRFIRDVSGNNLHAELIGGELVTGIVGKAMHFDGKSTATIPHHKRLGGGPNATVSVSIWCHGERAYINKIWNSSHKDWSLAADPDQIHYYGESDSRDFILKSSTGPPRRQWNHLAMVLDCPNRRLQLYINGVVVAADTNLREKVSAITVAPISLASTSEHERGIKEQRYACTLDELAIYDRALTVADVQALFAHGRSAARVTTDNQPVPLSPENETRGLVSLADMPIPFPKGGAVEQQKAWVVAELKRLNPKFDGQMNVGIKGGQIVSVSISRQPVDNIEPLAHLSHLRSLLMHNLAVKDLSPLANLPLQAVNFMGCRGITDISALAKCPLTEFTCHYTGLTDLQPLAGKKLTHVWIGETNVSDLSPLRGMPIRNLYIRGSKVQDLSPLKGMPVEVLDCGYTGVSDLSPLDGAPLKSLSAEKSPIRDLSPLIHSPLENYQGPFDPTRDAAILRQIKTLKTINDKLAASILAAQSKNELDSKNDKAGQ
jgi:serine/threonine protein kinase